MGILHEHPVIWNMEHTGHPEGRRVEEMPLCGVCGGEFYPEELTTYQEKRLCEDCLEARLWDDFTAQDGREFVGEREQDFYVDWWFRYLSDAEKLSVAKAAFLNYQTDRPAAAAEDVREYAFGSDFVKGKIKKEGAS